MATSARLLTIKSGYAIASEATASASLTNSSSQRLKAGGSSICTP
ncbi:hypothetical protein [Leptolyngbya sp. Heron Island J]|nr:hypothetical protein [Leptolyngbya sp. Heron Island J]